MGRWFHLGAGITLGPWEPVPSVPPVKNDGAPLRYGPPGNFGTEMLSN
jgi:hypothetical protein